jgi:hypothetical protein
MTRALLSRGRTAATAVAVVALVPAAHAGAATLTVTTTDQSSASECGLNDAISSANDNDDHGACLATGTYGDDTINITATGTINLSGSLTPITTNVDINGPGAGQLDIHRDSGGDYRVLSVTGGGDAQISGVTISNGRLTTLGAMGAGIHNAGFLLLEDSVVRDSQVSVLENVGSPSAGGGGIFNSGSLTVRRSTITNNFASSYQFAPSGTTSSEATGGGIYNNGNLFVERSTIDNNNIYAQVANNDPGTTATAGGGGMVNYGPNATVRTSTVSGNRTQALAPGSPSTAPLTTQGAGIDNLGTITLASDTIAFNTADSSASLSFHGSASLSAQGTETVTNTILWGGVSPNCDSSVNTDGGFNLEAGASTCSGLESALHSDPLLTGLAENGGPTRTHGLSPGSPAIDAGSSGGDTTDQRAKTRPVDIAGVANADDGADIGALEAQDSDGDGRIDEGDGCPAIPGTPEGGGCPISEGSVTIKYSKHKKRFKGVVSTPGFACSAGRGVDLYLKQKGDDKLVRQTITDPDSTWAIDKRGRKGKSYYARIGDAFRQDVAACNEATSPTIKIR